MSSQTLSMATAATDVTHLGSKPSVMISVSVAFLALTWTAVILRVYVRCFLIRSFGWDDWTMLLTLALFTGLCACLILIARIELGDELQEAAKAGILAEIPVVSRLLRLIVVFMGLYLWAAVVLKVSLAIFFLRVITTPWHRQVIYATTVVYTLYGVTFAFIGVFQCGDPKNFLINQAIGKCLSNDILQPMNYAAASLSALTDWIYVFFPLHVVWKAPMPRGAKISAGVLLAMAALGSVTSLVRIAYIPGIKAGPHFFSEAIDLAVWSVIEPGIGIITASLASLRPLFRRMREVSRNLKSMGSCGKSGDSKLRSRSSFGRKGLPASALSFCDRGGPRQQVHDLESGLVFELADASDNKPPPQSRGSSCTTDEMALLNERRLPRSMPQSPRSPQSLQTLQSSNYRQSRLSQQLFVPDDAILRDSAMPTRAYVREGKVIIRRSTDAHDASTNPY